MIKGWLHSIFEQKYSLGIDVEFLSGTKLSIAVCLLRKRKQELEQQENRVFSSYEDLFEYLKTRQNAPIYLNLRGEGVVTHCFENESSVAGSKDLTVSNQKIGGYTISSMARVELIDNVIRRFKNEGLFVLGVQLGANLSPVINVISKGYVRISSDWLLSIENNVVEISAIDKSQNSLTEEFLQLKDDRLETKQVYAFTSALSIVQKNRQEISGHKLLEQNTIEHRYKNRYQVVLKSVLICMLSALVLNYIVFDHYFKQNKILSEKISISKTELLKLESSRNRLESQKEFARVNSLTRSSLMAYRADRLALLLPSDTFFESLEVSPKKKTKKLEPLDFASNTIRLMARTSSAQNIELYIDQIEKLSWIEQVTIESVSPMSKTEQLQFTLILSLSKG